MRGRLRAAAWQACCWPPASRSVRSRMQARGMHQGMWWLRSRICRTSGGPSAMWPAPPGIFEAPPAAARRRVLKGCPIRRRCGCWGAFRSLISRWLKLATSKRRWKRSRAIRGWMPRGWAWSASLPERGWRRCCHLPSRRPRAAQNLPRPFRQQRLIGLGLRGGVACRNPGLCRQDQTRQAGRIVGVSPARACAFHNGGVAASPGHTDTAVLHGSATRPRAPARIQPDDSRTAAAVTPGQFRAETAA